MKCVKLSLAVAVALGLSSVALAGDEAAKCCAPDPCCGHGLLSKLKLHHCSPCCEAPKPCPASCDPCAGHKLCGMLKCIKLPHFGHGCKTSCCEPKPCAEPKCCKPKCCLPTICLPKICLPKPCCKPKCDPCDPCSGIHGCLAKLRGLLHHNGCCKPACDPCGGCGHKFSLHGLFGKHCGSCCEGTAQAPAATTPAAPNAPAAPKALDAPVPAPAPKAGAGASSNGLLILTPAG